ncbi:GntR family transcriptional regulator [Neobacillus sp. WH10]|uniref:GntR family transcriptional regulator n=1 Tax=Neobacillus sp. WH10 TaxID=3047873 RepID=UPI0024C1148B|nr:GntR family transcriptional regulator [Neobacillus sp. WH10]WHY77220.1 GntR family transcriptional regulator [Neobacillus sp. WH10]
MKLDTSKEAAPLYIQVKNDIKMKIENKVWNPGDKIPSELELCKTYDVSRITVREAINELVWEEYLIRKRPKGTFVLDQSEQFEKSNNYYTHVKGFTFEMNELGKQATTKKAEISMVKVDSTVAKQLNTTVGKNVYLLKRVRGTEDKIMVYFRTYIKTTINLSANPKDYYGSLYELLNDKGIKISKFKEYLEAGMPTEEVQKELNISADTPVLKRVRKSYCKEFDFAEYTECFYIGDQYRYYIDFNSTI